MKRKAISAVMCVLVVSITMVFVTATITQGQMTRIVRIYSVPEEDAEKIRIEPEDMWIMKKGTVIWVNSSEQEIKVNFVEGKQCDLGTDAPTQYSLAECGYVTSWVPKGATASLRFIKDGVYSYEVEEKDGTIKKTGRIVVQ